MSYNTVTTSDATITAEELQITGSSFTAVANRYYRVTYYEPLLSGNTANQVFTQRIRLTNLAGALQTSNAVINTVGNVFFSTFGMIQCVSTLTAGTQNFAATLACNTGTGNAGRTATAYAFLLVEDIGPA
jgi:hypothetical protein